MLRHNFGWMLGSTNSERKWKEWSNKYSCRFIEESSKWNRFWISASASWNPDSLEAIFHMSPNNHLNDSFENPFCTWWVVSASIDRSSVSMPCLSEEKDCTKWLRLLHMSISANHAFCLLTSLGYRHGVLLHWISVDEEGLKGDCSAIAMYSVRWSWIFVGVNWLTLRKRSNICRQWTVCELLPSYSLPDGSTSVGCVYSSEWLTITTFAVPFEHHQHEMLKDSEHWARWLLLGKVAQRLKRELW